METLWQDIRSGARGLARNAGFTAVAVVTLGLGIGANSGIFSVVNAVLLSALPFEAPARLVVLTGTNLEDGVLKDWPISYPDYADWRERDQSFEELVVHTDARSVNFTHDGQAQRLRAEMVSAGYFRLLGQKPIRGRGFSPQDDRPSDPLRVVVLSYDLWQSTFGGDPAVLDRPVVLDEESYRVLGVMPAGFRGVTDQAQLWLPVTLASDVLGSHYIELRPFRWLSGLGRLADGVSLEQARQAMDALATGLAASYPDSNENIGVRVTPITEAWVKDLRPALLILQGCAAFVLLLACINIANLLLVRTWDRCNEMAIRSALGAGRGRLLRQLLTESALLALLGGALGLVLAHWSTRLLVAASGVDLPGFIDLGVDARLLGFTVLISLACGLGMGLLPALLVSRPGLVGVLQGASRHVAPGGRRLSGTLVVIQVALALVLLVGAALMAKSFQRLRRTELGFEPRQLLTLRMDLKGPSLAEAEAKRLLVRQLLERLGALPGVGRLALEGPAIPTDDWNGAHFTLEERRDASEADELVLLAYHFVSPGYFQTLGVPLLEGQDFDRSQDTSVPYAAIVNETLARRFWPGEEVIGKRLKFGKRDARGSWMTVQGMVADIQHAGRRNDQRPAADVYFTLLQIPPTSPPILNLLLRPESGSGGGPDATRLVPRLREAVGSIAPHLPLYDVATLEERLGEQLARERYSALLLGLFAALALGLATIGIYGVISFSASQRTREVGIRLALGAEPSDVIRMVAGGGSALALLGVGSGLVITLVLIRVLASLLAGVLNGMSPSDPWILAATCLLLLAVALAASYLPARRASKVEPADILRIN